MTIITIRAPLQVDIGNKEETDLFENIEEPEYTDEEITGFINTIFSVPVLRALKFLRGDSGLDKSVLNILKDPAVYQIVVEGLTWLNNNYLEFDILMDFDVDSDDEDYEISESETEYELSDEEYSDDIFQEGNPIFDDDHWDNPDVDF